MVFCSKGVREYRVVSYVDMIIKYPPQYGQLQSQFHDVMCAVGD